MSAVWICVRLSRAALAGVGASLSSSQASGRHRPFVVRHRLLDSIKQASKTRASQTFLG
ncbi:hypothetical protein [Streptomyces sp. NPDC001833]|uniref:hypothetical protein n=1 Tax=Streptomyces sp. NPDC001833 TaxID=3154658 RepID=UPI0033333ED8